MKKQKYALIGCGKVAVKHLKAAIYQAKNRNNIEIAALVDTRQAAAAAEIMNACKMPKDLQKNVKIYQDYDEMLNQIKPDLTAITTPSGSHAVIGLKALRSGSHILLEKPLTLSLPEAELLLETAASRNLNIAVGHIYRFFPLVQEIQQDLAAGKFGRILYGDVKVRWGHDQAYYDQAAWRGTWAHDGGALMNQSIHALDLMIWLLGNKVLNATGRIDRQLHRMQAEDIGFATLQLTDGVWCQLEGTTNTNHARKEASFFIRCSEGEIRGGILSGRPQMKIYDKTGKNIAGQYLRRYLKKQWQVGGFAALKQISNPHSGLYSDWINSTTAGKNPIADGEGGLRAVEMVLAIYKSALLGRKVDLPLSDFSLEQMSSYFPEQP